MPRERILVVDDEIDVVDLCRRILENEGYHVSTARDGQTALAKAHAESFDLLLTDIKMPGMSGLDLAQAFKETDSTVVCITMTGYSTMAMAIDALRLGVDEFVVKPFTPDELISAISKALEKMRLRRENIRLKALIPLFELSKAFLSTVQEDDILERVVQIAKEETRASGSLIVLVDRDRGWLSARRSTGSLDDVVVGHRGTGWDFPWKVVDLAQDVAVSDLGCQEQDMGISEVGYQELLDQQQLGGAGASSLLGSRILMQEEPIGALIVARQGKEPGFSASDAEMLGILSGQVGIAISNARLFAEIRRAYEELKKLDHMKSEFINIAAHELRTPLAILMGYASILEEESSGETRERMEIVVRNAQRLRSLIDDMLNLRYLERGRIGFHPEPLRLADIVNEIVADLLPQARDKSLSIQTKLDPELPSFTSDRQKIGLVLANLLSNAIKFTPEEGRVAIIAEVQDGHLIVHVQDTGIGIPSEAYERIFEPFYQVEDSLTREHSGIGLGLAIAKGMIERCGGRIWVESVVGKGSRFSFIVPLQPLR